jgi:hypothetical protein
VWNNLHLSVIAKPRKHIWIYKNTNGVEAIPQIGRKWLHRINIKPIGTFFGTLLRQGDCFGPTNSNRSTKFLAGPRNDGACWGFKFWHCWLLLTRSFQDNMQLVFAFYEKLLFLMGFFFPKWRWFVAWNGGLICCWIKNTGWPHRRNNGQIILIRLNFRSFFKVFQYPLSMWYENSHECPFW